MEKILDMSSLCTNVIVVTSVMTGVKSALQPIRCITMSQLDQMPAACGARVFKYTQDSRKRCLNDMETALTASMERQRRPKPDYFEAATRASSSLASPSNKISSE